MASVGPTTISQNNRRAENHNPSSADSSPHKSAKRRQSQENSQSRGDQKRGSGSRDPQHRSRPGSQTSNKGSASKATSQKQKQKRLPLDSSDIKESIVGESVRMSVIEEERDGQEHSFSGVTTQGLVTA